VLGNEKWHARSDAIVQVAFGPRVREDHPFDRADLPDVSGQGAADLVTGVRGAPPI
jgi:hypothetical protein